MDLQEIKKFLDSGTGMAMKDYLVTKLSELKSIDNLDEKDVGTQQVVEVKGQKRAYQKLKEILEVIMTLSEDIKSKDPRDSFGITDEDIT